MSKRVKDAPSKGVAFIYNAIVALLCTLAIAAYFCTPFFEVEVSFAFSSELVEMMGSMSGTQSQDPAPAAEVGVEGDTTGGSTGEGSTDDSSQRLMNSILDQMGKDGVKISLGISLKTQDLLASLDKAKGKEALDAIIEDNIRNVTDSLDSVITKVVGAVTKSVVNESIKKSITESIGTNEDGTPKKIELDGVEYTVDEVLDDVGITDEFISGEVDALIDKIMSEELTVDDIADSLCDTVDNVYKEISQSDSKFKEEYLKDMPESLTEEERQSMKDSMNGLFGELGVDPDAKINGEDIVYTFIGMMLEQMGSSGDGTGDGASGGESESAAVSVGVSAFGVESSSGFTASTLAVEEGGGAESGVSGGESGSDGSSSGVKTYTKEDVVQMITDKLNSAIDEKTRELIVSAMQGIAYAILATFAIWAWVVVKMILKVLSKNPMVKLGLPIWLGHVPFWVLFAIPNLAMLLIFKTPSFIVGPMNDILGAEAAQTLQVVRNTISVTFSSCSLLTFLVGVALTIFAIGFYSPARKRIKRQIKADKRVAREANGGY